MSSSMSAVAIIVALLVGAGGTYALTSSMSSGTTTTTTITTNGGGGGVTTTTITATTVSQAALAQAECAKQTGVCLTIYSTMDASLWANNMAPVFFKEYPWAQGKVTFVNLRHAEVSSRPISEFQAGKVQADAIESSMGAVFPIMQAGAIQNYSSPLIQQMGIPSQYYDSHGAWVAVNELPGDIVYNTALMTKLGLPIPKTWTDLANPVYKGQITMATGSTMSTTASILYYLYTQMGNASWTQFMKGLAANQPGLSSSPGSVTDNVVAGKYALGIGLYNDYVDVRSNPNATVGAVLPNPVLDNPALVAVLNKAPHPEMAKLLEDFWISYAGQATYVASGYVPIDVSLSAAFGSVPTGLTSVSAWGTNPYAVFQNSAFWTNLFKSYLGF